MAKLWKSIGSRRLSLWSLSLSKRPQKRANEYGGFDKLNHHTNSTTEESWKCFVLSKQLKACSVVVEPVIAEPVEAIGLH